MEFLKELTAAADRSKIQTIKRIARGFRSKHTFKKMIRFAFQTQALQVIS